MRARQPGSRAASSHGKCDVIRWIAKVQNHIAVQKIFFRCIVQRAKATLEIFGFGPVTPILGLGIPQEKLCRAILN